MKPIPLSPESFGDSANQCIILDVRSSASFVDGFVPGSIHIDIAEGIPAWLPALIGTDQPLLLVADPADYPTVTGLLQQAGYTDLRGFLDGGFAAWRLQDFPIDMLIGVEADELAMDLPFDENLLLVDVRGHAQYAEAHITGVHHLPLSDFADTASMAMLPEHANIYLHGGTGSASITAASMLKRQGIHNIRYVIGGFDAIAAQQGIPVTREEGKLN